MGKTNQTKAEVSKKELAKAGDADHYSDLEDDELLALVFADEEGSKPVSKPKRKHKSLPKEPSKVNVLYLGHIPNGFHENEISKFLTQFGKVQNVRISRSKKSGKSRGYGFIQMENTQVAEIVQKTLHGFILLGRALVCQRVPEEHVHDKMFVGGLSQFAKLPHVNNFALERKKRVLEHGKLSESKGAEIKRIKRLVQADAFRKSKLAKKGINYEFSGGYEL